MRYHPIPIPAPVPASEVKELSEEHLPSGKWVQRVPRTLHRDLIRLAKREKVSLNQLVTSVLSEAVGARRAPRFLLVRRRAQRNANPRQSQQELESVCEVTVGWERESEPRPQGSGGG